MMLVAVAQLSPRAARKLSRPTRRALLLHRAEVGPSERATDHLAAECTSSSSASRHSSPARWRKIIIHSARPDGNMSGPRLALVVVIVRGRRLLCAVVVGCCCCRRRCVLFSHRRASLTRRRLASASASASRADRLAGTSLSPPPPPPPLQAGGARALLIVLRPLGAL